jgi:hypothetical protein
MGQYIIGLRYLIALNWIRLSRRLLVLEAASRAARVIAFCQFLPAPAGSDAESLRTYGRYRMATVALDAD